MAVKIVVLPRKYMAQWPPICCVDFSALKTSLEELILEDSSLPSNFIQDIGMLASLKNLEVKVCDVNGSLNFHGPLHLKNLESLVIRDTSLENNFLQKIGAMPSLKNLELWDCGLNGTLYSQGFCELTNLQNLDIRDNNLWGNLPECFSNFTSLESLLLYSNQFSGSISALKSLTSLRTLDLSDNYFEIPSSLGPLFNLSKLHSIFADNNTIYAETEMHSLAPTFQLNRISISCCGDVGSFPQFLYHQQDLVSVDLSNIYLKGEFPNWLLENNTNLTTLVLVNNSFLGPFQLPFLSHTGLSRLDISKNSFYGNIPNEIGAKLPSLWFLNMSKNHFGGSIPVSIGDMKSLRTLDLSDNKLSGGLPEPLAIGCSSLSVLILSNNILHGQMFSSNFNLTNLRQLQLDGNLFSGRIPDCLSNCSSLIKLDLSNNQLFGDIPRWMGNLSLYEIAMAKNHLEGPIPEEICQHNLEVLDLSVNNISGNLPSCFSQLHFSQIHLSRNKLQGPLINEFLNSTMSFSVEISSPNNNHFEGEIPVQLCKLSHLSLIDLSNNHLSGTIPPCLKITTLNDISQDYVRFIFTADRNMSSSIPIEEQIEFTTKSISYFYKGKVLTYLSGIDLSCNKLIGKITHTFKNIQNIQTLNLSFNSLTGPIPPAISELKQIESLDLSHNNLSGKIPSQLVGLNYLSFFSVAYNNLSGRTPERTAQFATFEESSYLGNHFLCGAPLPNCSTGPSSSMSKASTDNGSIDMNVFYVSFVVSYFMVLLSIACVLYINPYWRRACQDMFSCSPFLFVNDSLLNLLVYIIYPRHQFFALATTIRANLHHTGYVLIEKHYSPTPNNSLTDGCNPS
ncbi:LRR receptor-like serine/threonine-protein kinase GSO1 [Durio zibethinus]|uniref:LRR receptor-like serine/threonine-protein kinase GSO1 n=1 Tax=Durio zibethinus TaxID=66656 RepID=A0A6P5ZP88_DURZI|nr:LRR receptor-like serine/threonine-protein kinase GSO1 [Durio zibethinus]